MTEQDWLRSCDPKAMLNFMDEKATKRKAWLFTAACCGQFRDVAPDARTRDTLDRVEEYADGWCSEESMEEWSRSSLDVLREAEVEQGEIQREQGECGREGDWYGVLTLNRQLTLSRRTLRALKVVYQLSRYVLGYDVASPVRVARGLLNDITFVLTDHLLDWEQNPCDVHYYPYVLPWEIFVHLRGGNGGPSIWDRATEVVERRLCGIVREVFGNPFRPIQFRPEWGCESVAGLAREMIRCNTFDRIGDLGVELERSGCDDIDVLLHCYNGAEHVRGCWLVDLVLGRR